MNWYLEEVYTAVYIPHTIHGTGIFIYIWLIFMGFHVGKYTVRPMDPMGTAIFAGQLGDLGQNQQPVRGPASSSPMFAFLFLILFGQPFGNHWQDSHCL